MMGDVNDLGNLSYCLVMVTDQQFCFHAPPLDIALKIVGIFLLVLFGTIGNGAIIIIILKNRLLRLQPANMFLLNMAISDLLNLTICTVLYLFRNKVIFEAYYLSETICYASPIFTGKLSKHNFHFFIISSFSSFLSFSSFPSFSSLSSILSFSSFSSILSISSFSSISSFLIFLSFSSFCSRL